MVGRHGGIRIKIVDKQERYNKCLKIGIEYQDFITVQFLKHLAWPLANFQSVKYQVEYGENVNGVEIKLDLNFSKTANLFIETEERPTTDQPFSPAGIYHKDNSWVYVIGDYNTIFIFMRNTLQLLHKSNRNGSENS